MLLYIITRLHQTYSELERKSSSVLFPIDFLPQIPSKWPGPQIPVMVCLTCPPPGLCFPGFVREPLAPAAGGIRAGLLQ